MNETRNVISIDITYTDQKLWKTARTCYQLMIDGQAASGFVLTLNGFDDDPRDLHEIPEAVRLLERAARQGFLSCLHPSTGIPGMSGGLTIEAGLGALETWAIGNRRLTIRQGRVEIPGDLIEEFQDVLYASNSMIDDDES